MTWFRVDDGFGEHAKVDALGADAPNALAVWLLCGCASARALTDGFVSEVSLARSCAAIGPKNRVRGVAALLRVGLWERVAGGWAFHQWDDHQPTKADVRRAQELGKARKTEWKDRKRTEMERKRNGVPPAFQERPGDTAPTRPDPTRPVERESLNAREGVAATVEHSLAVRSDAKAEARRHFIREYGAAYEAAYASLWYPAPHQPAIESIAAWVADQPNPAAAASSLVAAAFAWEPWRRHRVPPRWIAEDPGLVLTRLTAGTSQPDDFSNASTSTEPPF